MPSTHTVVVLMPGTDSRMLGLSSRVRNARVAARAGAHVVDAGALAPDASWPAIFVPADVLIETSLFPMAPLSAPARLTADGESVLDISTPSSRRRAAWTILRRTEKQTDGWVSRRLNRPASRLISFALLSMGLTASHASMLTLAVGVLGAAVAAAPGYASFVAAGLLFHLASVFDGVDGEMARATLTESEAGARLDTLVDHLTYLAFFIGTTIGWAREGSSGPVLMWTTAIALALVLSLMRGARFVSLHAPHPSFVFIDQSVRRAADDSGQAILRAAAGLFTLLRRDVFAIIFVMVALTGIRALVPGLVAFGVILANFTLSIYDRELAAAAEQLSLGEP